MIALITDFGYDDNYAGVVKGVIKKSNPAVEVIDITHGVVSYSITNAQYMLYTAVEYFPESTVFYVVVDPGVGSDRRALIGRHDGRYIVVPDNGIISSFLDDGDDVYEVNYDYFNDTSSTFHGRDVFAPVAALLAEGVSPSELGVKINDWIRKPFPEYSIQHELVEGIIIHVDKFGNVVTSIPNGCVRKKEDVYCRFAVPEKSFNAVFCSNYSELKKGVPGIMHGSSGFIEIAMNMSSVADEYTITIEERISVLV